MKVLYLVEQYPRLSEIFITREIYGLENLGVDIDVLSLSKKPVSPVKNSLSSKVRGKTIYLDDIQIPKPEKALGHLVQFCSRPSNYLQLAKQVHAFELSKNSSYLFKQLPVFCAVFKSSGAKRLHAHFGRTGLVVAWMISRVLEVPYSVTLHGTDTLVSPYPSMGKLLLNAERVACVSEAIRRVVVDMGVERERTEVVHCGVDVDEFCFHRPAGDVHPLKILSVARLHPVKNLPSLVSACSIIHAAGIPFQCTIVGDGTEREALEKQIDDLELGPHFHLTGSLANEDLPAVYRSHSVFVLPSLSEGLPVTMMEAMASGLPVVATKVGGVPEIVEEGVNGKLVETNRPDMLAEAILLLHSLEPHEKLKMSLRNRVKIIDRFDINKEVYKLFDIFARKSETARSSV